ncbi:hypothetical protein KUTeg_010306 [Tegillarca granosa]|uniref:eRF1/Pelota-like N-terminal domain-containing protein n=1 Tax=Tegillarca granosa TaxID=220873 RepID=A0ABQ9F6E4_TEGGR|nr:hypothetical protein KUTeg_010306 [Tegillarca granosa]
MRSITLVPEEAEDMWHAYNLVAVGDSLRSTTIRKVQTESATGSVSVNKVRTTLTIQVENIDFDTHGCVLRVKGRNIEENNYFTLGKHEWDSVSLERIDMATDVTQHADLAAVVMQEGLAHLCLITSNMTLVRAKIETNIPRKRKGMCGQHDKGLSRFYDQIIQAILRHVNFENNKGKFLLVHSSSGFKHSLKEVLQDPAIASKLADTKASSEIKALDDFYQMLQNDPDRACYGVKHIERAADLQAVEVLLVSDELFRAQNVQQRKRYVNIVDKVKESCGDVKIFSSLHVILFIHIKNSANFTEMIY